MSLCNFFGVSRWGYYKGLRKAGVKGMSSELILDLVHQIRYRNPRMGTKKLYHILKDQLHGIDPSLGRDKFFDILRSRGLLVYRKRKYAITTQSHHRFRVYNNKLLDFTPQRPHQTWVCDITYIRTKPGFMYLFLITDAYSRKIVGWHLSKSLAIEGAVKALDQALSQCPDAAGLIHHSDRGFQYCACHYVNKLKQHGIQISMGEAGNCYDNAMAERVNGILKEEYGLSDTFIDDRQGLKVIQHAIRAYNEDRPHWSLQLATPSIVHAA